MDCSCSRVQPHIVGHCPHLEGWSVHQVSTVPYGTFQSPVTKMLSVLTFLESKVQSDCRENGLEQR
jgi:hypothetical protein